ncbi:asparagine synthetase B family protein [Duganella aceris]|uniref:asparagine synthase (glutamine-hydrolyzing) n=1 Tax=Duganella aceris TaxID=2703883 RepID=A0ABX0FRE3_9BURK|nr:asparagine synthase C-terminal domain-containing protein [Duganella aceris]NGZ87110.1 asparagine synthase [Duganella aceris]
MSGLCGYLNTVRDERGPRFLRRMAASMARFDSSPIHALTDGPAGVAVAACADGFSMHSRDGVLAAVWGRAALEGDTRQVAMRLTELWMVRGPMACADLSGPFAVCIVDGASGQVMLAVDRSGIHSMHYQSLPQCLLFGSSAAALRQHPDAHDELDRQALYHYLYFHMIPAPLTVYRGQQRLLPGEFLLYRRGRLERGSYWKMAYSERRELPFAVLKHQFLATLEHAVRQAAEGDGKVGAFLSGGTDSSTLAGMLGKITGQPASTYSIGFDVDGYDEMRYARIAARHFGTDHHEFYVTADDVMEAVPRLAAVSDQPFGNASAIPAYYCASMARADGVTRLLGGDGGDELFGGNERYARQAVFSRYEQLPSCLRQVLIEPLLFGLAGKLDLAPLRKARSYVEQALMPMPARLETYNLLRRYGAARVLHEDFLADVDTSAALDQLNARYSETHGLSQINRMQAIDLLYTLADNDLRKVRHACELAGVDAVFPFLNDDMLAFSSRLSPNAKLNGTRLRYFFKRALADHLPRPILRKKKHGFGLPFGHWLQSHAGLRELAFDSLNDLKRRRIVRAEFIDTLTRTLVREHPAYHGTMVWVLMMLEQWLCQHATRRASGFPADAAEIAADLAPKA